MSEILQSQFGEKSWQAITAMKDTEGELAVGNVLRRTCEYIGENACKQACRLYADDPEVVEKPIETPTVCADQNSLYALTELGLNPKEVVMVAVTKNEIGFADKLDADQFKQNPYGWREVAGYNAFFASETEAKGLGRRLADCADVNFELKDSDNNTVIGFIHGTRTGMYGKVASPYEIEGEKVSFTELAIQQAIQNYGADPTKIKIKLAAGIKAENFKKHFDSLQTLEEHTPGWFEEGFLTNATNPTWQKGDPVVKTDTWLADTRGFITKNIEDAMKRFGIPSDNFTTEGIIDPVDTNGAHSSYATREKYGDTRDLYLTYIEGNDE